jgi:hypothetical protein
MAKSLPIPAPAKRDPRAVEMVRTWIAEGKLHVALNVGFWEQPERGGPRHPRAGRAGGDWPA